MEVEKRLSVEGLMKPRYKCISDYPGNNLYPVGCIIEDDYPHWGIDLFPHLFKKLEWWEERKESELEPEEWADILGYEGYYQISTYGRVKSIIRKTERMHKGVTKYSFIRKEKILSLQIKPDGYVKVELSKYDITRVLYVHRLQGVAFITNPENKPFINHIKNIRSFNYVKNLEWCTQSENVQEGYKEFRKNNPSKNAYNTKSNP